MFSCAFCPDAPHALAVGGAKGEVSVWDIRAVNAVTQRYKQLRPRRSAAAAAAGNASD